MYMLVCYFMHSCIGARLPRQLQWACRSSDGDLEARAQCIVPLCTLHGGYCWQRKPPALGIFLQQRIKSTCWSLLPCSLIWYKSETENAHVETDLAVKYISGCRWSWIFMHPVHRRNRGSVALSLPTANPHFYTCIPYWRQLYLHVMQTLLKSTLIPGNVICFISGVAYWSWPLGDPAWHIMEKTFAQAGTCILLNNFVVNKTWEGVLAFSCSPINVPGS